VVNRARRDEATKSLRFFLETYFRSTFFKPWSADHIAIIGKLEHAIETGGQFALAAPRGAGKTCLTERAALWAVLTGRRKFVVIACASEALAEQALARIKSELEHNKLLLEDWPKACHPVRRLESQSRRCVGQLWEGRRTGMVWTRKRVTLAEVPGPDNEASGAVVHVCGLTSAVRGLSHALMDGRTARPDLLLVDDPSDREAAKSIVQTNARLSILNGDLMGLGGPGHKLAALCTCTIIFKDDFASQLLDHAKNPAWEGSTYKLVYDWPTRMDLWETYQRLRTDGMKPGGDREAHTEFLRSHFDEMHAGSRVGWDARFDEGQLSALQHAFDLRADRGEAAYQSEYQNSPIDETKLLEGLDAGKIMQRLSGFDRLVIPPECERLTAFVDCGQYAHWFMVCAFTEDFTAYVVDYGVFPPQRSRIFDSRSLSPTLESISPGGVDAQVYGGLQAVVALILGRQWIRSDGAEMRINRILIDSGWKPEVVRLFIRQSEHKAILIPSKGKGVGPSECPMPEYPRKTGEKRGDYWMLGKADSGDRLRLLKFDSNAWKSRASDMLIRALGLKGGLSLYGSKPAEHELVASHLASEYPVLTEAAGRSVNVWKKFPDKENHWFDGLIGCLVGGSFEGLNPLASIGGARVVESKKKKVSFAVMQREAQNRRGRDHD
jgi:hypothetical protein